MVRASARPPTARRNVYYAAFRSVNYAAAQTQAWPPPTSPPLAEDALNSTSPPPLHKGGGQHGSIVRGRIPLTLPLITD